MQLNEELEKLFTLPTIIYSGINKIKPNSKFLVDWRSRVVFAYEHLLSIPPLISPPWGFVNLLPRVILSCAVHRDNFLILPVPRQSSDSFVSIVREIVYRTLKQTGSGRVSKLDSVWMSEVRLRVRVVLFRVASRSKRRLKQKETAYCSVVGSTLYLALKKNLRGK